MTGAISRRVLILGAAVLAAGCIRGRPQGRIRVAAGEPGGLYLAFAELLAERVRVRFPDIGIEVVPTQGSVDNLARLRAGDVDMGLALADVAEQDQAAGDVQAAPQAVARVYENYLQLVVRESAGVRHLADLRGQRVSIGAAGSGAAVTSQVLLDTAGLTTHVQAVRLGLREGLARLSDGGVDALVWSGGVPTPAIAELDATLPLRMLDIGDRAEPMADGSGYPYVARRVPTVSYVPAGLRSIGVPDLLMCRAGTPPDVVAAVVEVLATEAPRLVPRYVRGLQYLDPPAMIQTGRVPLHSGAVDAYRRLHG